MIKTQYPYIDDNGQIHNNLIKTYTDTENKVLLQVETGIIYGTEVIDVYPCRYTYDEVDEPEPEEEETPEEE